VNIVNKIDAVLITYTYTLQNILQVNAPIKQIFTEIVLIYLKNRVGEHQHHHHHHHNNNNNNNQQQQQEISRNYLLLFNLICIPEYMCCLRLNYPHVCGVIK
jgi:hypothetical protein